jgi:lambda repressor-like predicted transcriptional regulator
MNLGDLLKKSPEKIFAIALEKKEKELADLLIDYVKDPFLLYDYADVFNERLQPKFEDIIAQDAEASYYYALNILQGPFPKGEDVMATDLYTAYHYAADVLHKPFPKGEAIISNFPYSSYYYAKEVLHDRFPKGEKAIIESRGQPDNAEPYFELYIEFLKSIGKLAEFLKAHPEVKL